MGVVDVEGGVDVFGGESFAGQEEHVVAGFRGVEEPDSPAAVPELIKATQPPEAWSKVGEALVQLPTPVGLELVDVLVAVHIAAARARRWS